MEYAVCCIEGSFVYSSFSFKRYENLFLYLSTVYRSLSNAKLVCCKASDA
jgi:hypothetical protein